MLVSMMERADRAAAVPHSLLINHRAYGGLQQLASGMFYKMKMISGHPDEGLFPPSVQHLQRYLERFLDPGQTCREPRLIAYSPRRGEVKVGTSWFNEDHGVFPPHFEPTQQNFMACRFDTGFGSLAAHSSPFEPMKLLLWLFGS